MEHLMTTFLTTMYVVQFLICTYVHIFCIFRLVVGITQHFYLAGFKLCLIQYSGNINNNFKSSSHSIFKVTYHDKCRV